MSPDTIAAPNDSSLNKTPLTSQRSHTSFAHLTIAAHLAAALIRIPTPPLAARVVITEWPER